MPRRLLSLALIALLAVSCTGEDDGDQAGVTSTSAGDGPTSTGTAPVTSTTVPGPRSEACGLEGSSPGEFDAGSGVYATFLAGVDVPGRTISFDVIRFLVGDDAVEAYAEERPDDPDAAGGPPNGFHIVNQSPMVRQAPAALDIRVRLVRLLETGTADLKPGTFQELPAYLAAGPPSENGTGLSANPYWLTFDDGRVVDLCEQYLP